MFGRSKGICIAVPIGPGFVPFGGGPGCRWMRSAGHRSRGRSSAGLGAMLTLMLTLTLMLEADFVAVAVGRIGLLVV
jgi:hypothetical protein